MDEDPVSYIYRDCMSAKVQDSTDPDTSQDMASSTAVELVGLIWSMIASFQVRVQDI